MTARTPALDPEHMSPEQRAVHDELRDGPRGGVRGPFPVLLQVPELARRVGDLGLHVRFAGMLDRAVAEVAILVVAAHMRCQYEGHAHGILARDAGVPDDAVRAILAGDDDPGLPDEGQRLAHDYARELLRAQRVSDGLHAAAVARFGVPGTVGLVATIAYFRMVATVLNAYEVGLPPGAEPPFVEGIDVRTAD